MRLTTLSPDEHTKKLDSYIAGEVWNGRATAGKYTGNSEDTIILFPRYTYTPVQRKKKRTVYTDLLLNVYGIIQIAKTLETILILVSHKTDQIKQICHPTQ